LSQTTCTWAAVTLCAFNLSVVGVLRDQARATGVGEGIARLISIVPTPAVLGATDPLTPGSSKDAGDGLPHDLRIQLTIALSLLFRLVADDLVVDALVYALARCGVEDEGGVADLSRLRRLACASRSM
jgi:hypothetical protein